MSRQDARRTIVAYDIANDARRTRMSHILERYGDRVQHSVFLVDLGAAGLTRMKSEVTALLDANEDSVLLCDLGPLDGVGAERFMYLGRTRPTSSPDTFVV